MARTVVITLAFAENDSAAEVRTDHIEGVDFPIALSAKINRSNRSVGKLIPSILLISVDSKLLRRTILGQGIKQSDPRKISIPCLRLSGPSKRLYRLQWVESLPRRQGRPSPP